MSQLHQQRRHISHPAHPETQVASSNSTVNAFMGGRQPAWMAGARPVRPTPRPDHPRQSIRPPLPPTSSATVLPSPAPSDEPSPAVSNPRDSPHSRPDSLAEQPAQNMRQPDLSQQARPVTDVRFVHEPALSADPQPASSFVHSDDAGGVIASSSHISPPGALELSAAPPPSYHALTAASHVAGGRQAPVGRPGDVQRSVPSPRLSLNLEHPFKKRRLTYSGESSSFASFTSNIDAHIQHCGGQRCLSEVERARLQILREACTKEDNFYIALHQLFAVWSLDSQEAYRYVTCSPAVVDAAFEVIGSVLKKNSLLSAPHVSFFAHFPMAIEPLLQFSGQYAATFESVSVFLARLTETWASLTAISLNRRFPYLVDELLGVLHCASPVLQVIFFTASRRRIGVMDGALGTEWEQAFRQDQRAHMNDRGQFITVNPIESDQDLEHRNSSLVHFYRQTAKTVLETHQPHVLPPSAQPSSPLIRQMVAPQGSTRPGPDRAWAHGHQQRVAAHARPTLQGRSIPSPLQSSNILRISPQMASPQFPGASPNPSQPGLVPSAPAAQRQVPSNLVLQSSHAIDPATVAPHAVIHDNPASQNTNFQPFSPQLQGMPYQAQMVHAEQRPPELQRQHQQLTAAAQQLQPPQHPPVFPVAPFQSGPSMVSSFAPSSIGQPRRVAPAAFVVGPPAAPASYLRPEATQGGLYEGHGRLGLTLLIPPRGHIIARSDYAHDPTDKKSIIMSLHQAEARSPQRVRKHSKGDDRPGGDDERYYQSVKSCAVGPTLLRPEIYIQEFIIVVSQTDHELLCKDWRPPGVLLPVSQYVNGSLRYRLRCCRTKSGVNDIAETDWVTLESSWPPNIFFKLNEKTLNIRRHTHNGKDLPVELTSLLIAGQNTLKVVVTQPKAQRCSRYFLAVEVIETLSHSEVMSRVLGLGRLRAEDTLQKIRTRLSTLEEDGDSIAIVVKDLSVDLADPFSATIFKVPARGATCTHMECFDLETWLNTRPAKPNAACLHRVACNCPKSTEPSNPDRWKCPICFKDARPVSLRIDMFLFGVRAQLEKECKLQAKSMLVSADGSWRPVIEAGGEGEDSDGEGGYTPARMARKVTSASAEPNVAVIELLDDD